MTTPKEEATLRLNTNEFKKCIISIEKQKNNPAKRKLPLSEKTFLFDKCVNKIIDNNINTKSSVNSTNFCEGTSKLSILMEE